MPALNVEKPLFFDILRNRFYIGDVFVPAYNDDPDQYVKGVHEPLIDRITFEQVQKVLAPVEKRKRNALVNEVEVKRKLSKVPKSEFYLHGFMVCPECGAKIYASYSKGRHNRYPYYHCNRCRGFRMRSDVANNEFETMLNMLKPKENIKKLFAEIFCDVVGESRKDMTASKENIQNEMVAVQSKLNKAQDMLLEDKISAEDFSDISARIKKQIGQQKERLEYLQSLPSESEIVEKMTIASRLLEHLGDFLRGLPVNERLDICGSILSDKIRFSKEKTRTVKFKDVISLICDSSGPYNSETETVPPAEADSTAWCPEEFSFRTALVKELDVLCSLVQKYKKEGIE